MGIYVYTLRKTTKKISGLEVARYAFAYKEGWGADEIPSNRRRIEASYRAADAVDTPYYVFCSDFADVVESPSEANRFMVFKRNDRQLPANVADSSQVGADECVGYLAREGRKIILRK